jgi:hypothetical protein
MRRTSSALRTHGCLVAAPSRRIIFGCSAARHLSTSTAVLPAGGDFLTFTADRQRYAQGLPDFVDHGNINNNPGTKQSWRREQAQLPKDIVMLRRKKATQVIERLDKAREDDALQSLAPGMLLTGGEGSGKSTALLNIVEWAKTAGWLVCYVPNGAPSILPPRTTRLPTRAQHWSEPWILHG